VKRRPVLFGSAAAVGLWSAWIVLRNPASAQAGLELAKPVARAPAPRPRAEPAASMPVGRTADARTTLRPKLEGDAGADAFAPRDWEPPPPPPPPPPPVMAPPPPAPPPPPPPPVLPYRFVGLLDDKGAVKPRVFLSFGEKLLIVSAGDSLEGGFRLDAITAQELVFTHIQNNVTLRLDVQGGKP
jgi:hypothetical protein